MADFSPIKKYQTISTQGDVTTSVTANQKGGSSFAGTARAPYRPDPLSQFHREYQSPVCASGSPMHGVKDELTMRLTPDWKSS